MVVQKTIEISQLQLIDKVLPYVVAQRQIPMVLRQCRKLWSSAVAIHHGSAAVLGQGCLHARCVQTVLGFRRAENCGVPQLQFLNKVDMPVVATSCAVLVPGGDARCCDDRCSS